ncbi:hypothetical protein BDP55DRAFT_661826 [Colletotrichum godetiae]|uniref:Uncharacterized protein n=1 Tax=Colletotrichum godetiae TaxID=1209918 RepID=A0AAJ0EYY8_9PEZI|nr:uncharacterized protein BDP55DRAFT_661826 [Colletotrichum godetiae]KAK1676675.1 hypothetical protein BDP55DRAFT_661826 [Colletotrichum godetiae]
MGRREKEERAQMRRRGEETGLGQEVRRGEAKRAQPGSGSGERSEWALSLRIP